MKKILTIAYSAFVLSFSGVAISGEPTCHHHSSGPYCRYSGKVQQIYINSGNSILLYFDKPFANGAPESVGISGVRHRSATIFDADDNPEFARMFYSTALAAQASGRNVTIQMRGSQSGYLKFDRIWLSAP